MSDIAGTGTYDEYLARKGDPTVQVTPEAIPGVGSYSDYLKRKGDPADAADPAVKQVKAPEDKAVKASGAEGK